MKPFASPAPEGFLPPATNGYSVSARAAAAKANRNDHCSPHQPCYGSQWLTRVGRCETPASPAPAPAQRASLATVALPPPTRGWGRGAPRIREAFPALVSVWRCSNSLAASTSSALARACGAQAWCYRSASVMVGSRSARRRAIYRHRHCRWRTCCRGEPECKQLPHSFCLLGVAKGKVRDEH
jgi:hypothetical protein